MPKSDSFFLWSKATAPRAIDYVGFRGALEEIEARLSDIYPGAEPVLFSSARAGINTALQHIGLSRPKFVWLPEFSSHCVLDAVGYECTPTPTMQKNISAALVFHQWGILHQAKFPKNVTVLDDSVDSLFIPGTSPLSDGANYAFLSLPKVLGTLAGGVVFCRLSSDAHSLRQLRANRPSSLVQAALRLASYSNQTAALYWNGAEARQGGLIAPLRRQILHVLDHLDQTVEDRIEVLRYVLGKQADAFIKSGRLPSNLPLAIPEGWEKLWGLQAPFTSGLRSFNVLRTCPQSEWVKVAPLPVHRDISRKVISKLLFTLNKEWNPNELKIV